VSETALTVGSAVPSFVAVTRMRKSVCALPHESEYVVPPSSDCVTVSSDAVPGDPITSILPDPPFSE
jgi:hypothetical protein